MVMTMISKIDDVKKQIKQANEHLVNVRQATDNAEYYQKKLFEVEKNRLPKQKRLDFLNKHAAKLERLRILSDYEQKVTSAKEELDRFHLENGKEFPDEKTFSEFENDARKIEELRKKAEKTAKEAESEASLSAKEGLLGPLSKADLEKYSQSAVQRT